MSAFAFVAEDARSIRERDPAAVSYLAVLLCYRGFHARNWHRVTNWLWRHRVRTLARVVSEIVTFSTGVEIHPGATLGRRLFIDHGTGVVIGETAIVGDDVTIYQGVTLGGTGKERGKRHPTIGDGAFIGVGAAVLGNITIGARTRVGAGAVVVRDVPEDCTVVGVPGRIVTSSGKRTAPATPQIELQPDTTIEMLRGIFKRLEALENEATTRGATDELCREIAEYTDSVTTRFETEEWSWEI